MRKIILSLIILFCLTGCWNYKELNDYSIVSGVAIDKDGDEYQASVLISNSPKSDSGDSSSSQSQVVVYDGKGDSIFSSLKQSVCFHPYFIFFSGE